MNEKLKTLGLIGCLLCSLFCGGLHAQERLDSALFSGLMPVQEKVYLHFDNNCYAQGDTIWWKAYVVRADNLAATPLSRILYVELRDEQGFLQERQQTVVDFRGQSHGQFALRPNAFPGHYEVRAYTKWMMNFHDGLYMDYRLNYNNSNFNELLVRDKRTEEYNDLRDLSMKTYPRTETDLQRMREKWASPSYRLLNIYDEEETLPTRFKLQQGVFSRVLSVYQRTPDSLFRAKLMPQKMTMGDYTQRWRTDEVNVRYFPEGGHLVEGVPCRVGWEISDREGRRLNVEGTLTLNRHAIATARPLHAGRGRFQIEPQKGSDYRLEFDVNGQHYDFPLPEPEPYGCALTVSQEKGEVRLGVQTNLPDQRPLWLSVMSRGLLQGLWPVERDSNNAVILTIGADELPAGICQATVFDADEQVLADRLFFVKDSRLDSLSLRLRLGNDHEGLAAPRAQTTLSFSLTDAQGRPAAGQTFSLSVRDREQLDADFSAGNVFTSLLLQSEVLGFVEDPEYYFEQSAVSDEALDQLMMIQGWRRYKWEYSARPSTFHVEYPNEQTTTLSGRASNLRMKLGKKSRGPIDVYCSLWTKEAVADTILFQGVARTDSMGRFAFTYTPFYGDAVLTLRGHYAKGKSKRKADLLPNSHDGRIFIQSDYFHPLSLKPLSWYELHCAQEFPRLGKHDWALYEQGNYPTTLLPETLVKGKRKNVQRSHNAPVVGMKLTELENIVWDIGWPQFGYDPHDPYGSAYLFDAPEDAGIWRTPGLDALIKNQYVYDSDVEGTASFVEWRVGPAEEWRLYFKGDLDSIYITTDNPRRPTDFWLDHSNRQSALVVHSDRADRRRRTLSGDLSGTSVYINCTENKSENKHMPVGREYHLKGFSRPAEFYSPLYAPDAQRQGNADHRRTLYWNPAVVTDESGRATVTFCNSDVCQQFDISVESVTPEGRIISYETRFSEE